MIHTTVLIAIRNSELKMLISVTTLSDKIISILLLARLFQVATEVQDSICALHR